MNPVTQTGTAVATVAGVGSVLSYVLPLVLHATPPGDVVMALAAGVVWIGHFISNRFGKSAATATVTK